MSAVRARSRRGEGERLREEILAAVGDLLLETQDEAAVSIRAIAERVGVSAPSIYRHFADKDALMDAVCAGVFRSMLATMEPELMASADPFDRLVAISRAYVTFGLANPEHYRLVFMRRDPISHHHGREGDADEGPLSAAAIAGSEAFELLVVTMDAILQQLPKNQRPDLYVATNTMWASIHGITSLRIAKSMFDWPTVDEQLDFLIAPWRRAIEHAAGARSKRSGRTN